MMLKRSCSAILVFLAGLMAHAQDTVVLVSDPYPPYVIDAPVSKGFVTDIAIRAFALEGIKAEYRNVPFKRAIKGVEDGTFDIVLSVAKGGRSTLVYPEETRGEFRTAFFVRKDSTWQWRDSTRDLENIRLGFITGYEFANANGIMDYVTANARDERRIHMQGGSDGLEKNIRMLTVNRIDALLDDELVVLYTANKLGVSGEIRLAGYLKTEKPEYISVGLGRSNPRSELLARAFDRGVRQLRQRGEFDQILRHYGLK